MPCEKYHTGGGGTVIICTGRGACVMTCVGTKPGAAPAVFRYIPEYFQRDAPHGACGLENRRGRKNPPMVRIPFLPPSIA